MIEHSKQRFEYHWVNFIRTFRFSHTVNWESKGNTVAEGCIHLFVQFSRPFVHACHSSQMQCKWHIRAHAAQTKPYASTINSPERTARSLWWTTAAAAASTRLLHNKTKRLEWPWRKSTLLHEQREISMRCSLPLRNARIGLHAGMRWASDVFAGICEMCEYDEWVNECIFTHAEHPSDEQEVCNKTADSDCRYCLLCSANCLAHTGRLNVENCSNGTWETAIRPHCLQLIFIPDYYPGMRVTIALSFVLLSFYLSCSCPYAV